MLIGVITDIHLSPPGHPAAAFHNPYAFADAAARFEQALVYSAGSGADLIAVLGDLSHPGDEETLAQGVANIAAAGRPVWLVAGNHDVGMDIGALPRAVARLNAEQVRLATPDGQANSGGFRIAGLMLEEGAAADEPRAGSLNVAAWQGDTVILLSHYPIVSLREQADAAGIKYAGDLEGQQHLAASLRSRAYPTIVLHGHIHLGHVVAYGPLLQISFPALIEPPHAVTLLDLTQEGEQLTVRLQESSVLPASEIPAPRLSVPDQIWRFASGAWSPVEG